MTPAPIARDPKAELLDRTKVALVLIDLQYRLLATVHEQQRVLSNCSLLLRLARVLELPVILTTQYAGGLGNIHPEILNLIDGVRPFDKLSFGCFGDANFPRHLASEAPQANTLLLAGVESHICVAQTALGAIAAGYLVHVAADAVSSRSLANWQSGLERMERAGAVMVSTEMAAYELLGRAGTPEFKAMLPRLK
ncbi:MAG TPA: isochorismatase family protein [Terriglobia bacterium]|nr:isochorismatase family protein [Terriglobia bacterium]